MSRNDFGPGRARRVTRGLLLAAAFLAGCGPRAASVSGTVTIEGRPLPSGTVLFHGADGRIEHAPISAGGKYTVADAPVGHVRITVKSHGAAPPGLPSSGAKPPAAPPELAPRPEDLRDRRYVAVPARYLDPDRSGLKHDVRPGSQSCDIELRR